MSEQTLFDRHGRAVAYLVEDGPVYTWGGEAVAYTSGDRIYGWNGRHLGWWVDEVVYDRSGARIGFTSRTCPATLQAAPAKSVKKVRRVKSVRQVGRVRPVLKAAVSTDDLRQFLQGDR